MASYTHYSSRQSPHSITHPISIALRCKVTSIVEDRTKRKAVSGAVKRQVGLSSLPQTNNLLLYKYCSLGVILYMLG